MKNEMTQGIDNTDISSLFITFKDSKKLDIRAHQRTYDGAYTRASIAILMFALLITKLFSKVFLPIGLVYTIYGSLLFIIAVHRSHAVNNFLLGDGDKMYFKTAGNIVALIGIISLLTYIALLVLILRLE